LNDHHSFIDSSGPLRRLAGVTTLGHHSPNTRSSHEVKLVSPNGSVRDTSRRILHTT